MSVSKICSWLQAKVHLSTVDFRCKNFTKLTSLWDFVFLICYIWLLCLYLWTCFGSIHLSSISWIIHQDSSNPCQINFSHFWPISGPSSFCYAVNNQTFCGMTGGFLEWIKKSKERSWTINHSNYKDVILWKHIVTNGVLFFVRHGLNFFQHKEDSWRPPPLYP